MDPFLNSQEKRKQKYAFPFLENSNKKNCRITTIFLQTNIKKHKPNRLLIFAGPFLQLYFVRMMLSIDNFSFFLKVIIGPKINFTLKLDEVLLSLLYKLLTGSYLYKKKQKKKI